MPDGAITEAPVVDGEATIVKGPEVVFADLDKELKTQTGEFLVKAFQERGGDLGAVNSLNSLSIFLKKDLRVETVARKQVEVVSAGASNGTPSQTEGERVPLVEINLPVAQELRQKIADRKKDLPSDTALMRDKNFPLFYSPTMGLGHLYGVEGKNSEIMVNRTPVSEGDTSVKVLMTQDNFNDLAKSVGFK